MLSIGVSPPNVVGPSLEDEDVSARLALLMYERASVRAPARRVVGVARMSASVVLARRARRLCQTSVSMTRKGRYLFAESEEEAGEERALPLPLMVGSCVACGREEVVEVG